MEDLVRSGKLFRAETKDIDGKIPVGLVRSPYKRLESIYKEKFIKNGDNNGDIHNTVRRALGISGNINKVPYESFINSLDKIKNLDPHLFTQDSYLNNNHVNFFKMEDGLGELEDIVGCKLEKHNNTDDIKIKFTYTDSMINTINNIYGVDFDRFKYETK